MYENKDFVLRSILYMCQTEWSTKTNFSETEVYKETLLNTVNPASVASMIFNTRENARTIRNTISTELWETVNKWYFYVKQEQEQLFSVGKIFPTTEQNRNYISYIRSDIYNTLLRDNVWHFIMLGMLVERLQQVIKILKSKISDCNILSENGLNESLLLFQYIVLLRCVEAYDLHTSQNRGQIMSLSSIFELVLRNDLFPRSLNFIINNCQFHFNRINGKPADKYNIEQDFTTMIQKVNGFKEADNEESIISLLDDVDGWATNLHNKISDLFFQ
jgi:uncharacterized alpha-E superfamily protein